MRKIAERLADIEPFRVVEVLTRARELEAQGRDIVHLEVGEPDFATAQPICEAGAQALIDGHTAYTPALGIMPLREAIAEWYQRRHNVSVAADRIVITPGASGALLLLSALLVNPGDGVLLADPGYPCNRHFVRMMEGEAQLVAVTAAERYQLSGPGVAAHWQANTAGVMVASPANPTGEILPRSALRALWEAVQRRSGYLIVDEIYHGLSFGAEVSSILEVTSEAFVVNSFSKYFGMTGWRLGWLVAPEDAVGDLEKLAQNLFISPSAPAQYAALACFEPATLHLLEERRLTFKARRDYLLPALRELGFGIPHCPDGGFYLYADIGRFSSDSRRWCANLLEEQGVAVTPGADFGRYQAERHVRFAYTTEMDALREAVRRLEAALR